MAEVIQNDAERPKVTIRALLLGHRIDTAGLERPDMINATPLAFHVGAGQVALYRFGVAVLSGLTTVEEEAFVESLSNRVIGVRGRIDDEVATVEFTSHAEDVVPPGGPMQLVNLSDARFLVVADVLAKSVALARDPELDRLYARLEDEYELKERDRALQRKLDVIVETVRAITDILDTNRSTRLEVTIVGLILFEVLVTIYQLLRGALH